jgi:hypothetical protein
VPKKKAVSIGRLSLHTKVGCQRVEPKFSLHPHWPGPDPSLKLARRAPVKSGRVPAAQTVMASFQTRTTDIPSLPEAFTVHDRHGPISTAADLVLEDADVCHVF